LNTIKRREKVQDENPVSPIRLNEADKNAMCFIVNWEPFWEKDSRLKIQDNGVYGGSSRFNEISNFRNSAEKSPLK
jgi:hypothetical protein